MKKVILFISIICCIFSCNDSKDIDRIEEYMNVYIPLCVEKNSILQTVPLVKNSVNFVEISNFNFNSDTLFLLGAYCGGTLAPSEDLKVEFSLATDSLVSLQKKNVSQSVYQQLPEKYYSIENWNVTIPKGHENGYLNVNLKLSQIPAGSKFILPIRINSVSKYDLDPEKSFILLAINKPDK
ncbi:DUF1735 domain-containing protein [Parabacteroides sp. AM08-6]|uniref:DUF1735 domain-containing protein n=1 Tax=Parabacteroides sp. AM08-6 TaxID=2292053 RepID=UPI000F00CC81|nr:DUF1735 domain-containing protein [Parabacteroides sp. AM08-6]RHJ86708.1 DUF1735 domain-containing protein [Parabacteroides sp. AM08-6]